MNILEWRNCVGCEREEQTLISRYDKPQGRGHVAEGVTSIVLERIEQDARPEAIQLMSLSIRPSKSNN